MKLLHGDCLDVLRGLADNSVDSVVTDPPYGLAFMGKKWDYDVPSEEIWRECLRVLKPGGHLLAFAGTRTQHRMAVRIEDAGFEIRDMIAWVYGSGFNKVGYIRGDDRKPVREGWAGSLKPALEPITVARKPLGMTLAECVLAHGTGGLNIDGCRVSAQGDPQLAAKYASVQNAGARENSIYGTDRRDRAGAAPHDAGRWPANLIHDGSDEVVGLFPDSKSTGGQASLGAFRNGDVYGKGRDEREIRDPGYGDTGSAARFFQQCKGGYNEAWQDQNLTPSSANTAAQSSSLQSQLAVTVQNAVAIWPSLAGILSSEQPAVFTTVTPNESKAISETAMQAMASIASGFLQESQHERRTPCNSLVKSAAIKKQIGTTTITTNLCRSDGSAASATFNITPSNLDLGVQACRFNYCAKASKRDRDEGLEGFEKRNNMRVNGPRESEEAKHATKLANVHPTVKPTDLMRYLCRLVTPPGGVVLDPFMGSGSTGKAAVLEGFQFIGIEREAEYLEIAKARIAAAQPDLFGAFQ